jgi:signal transduction histidine kinase
MRTRLFASSFFRYAIAYVLVFALSVAGVLGFVYWRTVEVIGAQTDETIEAEVQGLAEQYRLFRLPGLISLVRERSTADPERRGLYALVDQNRQMLAGNLSEWPAIASGPPGWITFLLGSANGGDRPQVARAQTFALENGRFWLLVGRDMTERSDFQKLISDALIGGLVLTAIVGLVGGILMSRGLLGRIDAIGSGAAAILRGDLARRMPIRGTGDEFDRLSRQLNEMLDQISHLMDGMRSVADSIAHDLRSPINRLRSRVEVTLMGPADAGAYRAALEETIRESDRILATFNALLVHDLAELYGPVAEEHGLTLHGSATDEVVVFGHRQLLSQAVANLLDNAIKYTPRGGRILIVVDDAPTGPALIVEDNGPGIPAGEREHVLQRFVRLDQSRSQPGAGLGLSLVAAVAVLHHARLQLEDASPGLRAILRFEPPAGPAPAARVTRQPSSNVVIP